jgi:uncharacterized protein (DUF736 family)
MPDFDNTNRGALFKNTDDDKVEGKHPDYRGRLNVNGTDLWLSAWIKTSKNGMRYMSLAVKPQNADAAQPKNATAKPVSGGSFDDTIPFAPEVR